MNQYYFAASSLPPLTLETLPELPVTEFDCLMHENLTSADFEKIRVIRLLYDIQNIGSLWKGNKLDSHGNFNEYELQEALASGEGLPEYVYDFLDRYETIVLRLKNLPALLSDYFVCEARKVSGFLKEYLLFEREWRLILTYLRAKKLHRNVMLELRFEDRNDEMMVEIFGQEDAKTFTAPEQYRGLNLLFEQHMNDPLKMHQSLSQYRFDMIDRMVGMKLFSIDQILSYFAQLLIVEKSVVYERKV